VVANQTVGGAETRSGWLRNDLVERVRSSTSKPVEHVVSEG
jgi:hypothetical protein